MPNGGDSRDNLPVSLASDLIAELTYGGPAAASGSTLLHYDQALENCREDPCVGSAREMHSIKSIGAAVKAGHGVGCLTWGTAFQGSPDSHSDILPLSDLNYHFLLNPELKIWV